MSLLTALRSPDARADALKTGAIRFGWSFLVPLAATLVVLRALVPSRMDAGSGGLGALLARFAGEHPLILGVGLFMSLSETLRYWLVHLGLVPRRTAALESTAAAARRRVVRFALALASVAVVALALRTCVAQICRVVSVSMLPTLNVGDRVIVDELAYGLKIPFSGHRLGQALPRRGDVIVFEADEGQAAGGPRTVVKRVLGLPGDYIAFQMGHAIVNNWVVPSCDAGPFVAVMGTLTVRGRLAVEFLEDHVYLTVKTPGGASFSGYRVLPGELFLIGDDRGISSDSRVWNEGRGGGVRIDAVEGRVSRILAGGRRDGRIDLGHLLSPLGLKIREPDVDLRKSEVMVNDCLRSPPPSTWPPASGA